MSAVLSRTAIPHPRTVAYYTTGGRTFPDATVLRSASALAEFLRGYDSYSLFGKPIDSARSFGTNSVLRYLPDEDSVELGSGSLEKVDEFANGLTQPFVKGGKRTFGGHMFQELVATHEAIKPLCGIGLPPVRVVVLLHNEAAVPFRACLKLPEGDNVADNFWRLGNILAYVDVESGQVGRGLASTRSGPKRLTAADSDKLQLTGLRIPDWDKYLELIHRFAPFLYGMKIQHWDLGIADEGPVLIEINDVGDLSLTQMVSTRGFLDYPLLDVLAESGHSI